MKLFGWVLVVLGIIMLIVPGVNFKTKEKVVDLGPVEINKTENHSFGWPVYAGSILTLAGVVLLVASNKKSG